MFRVPSGGSPSFGEPRDRVLLAPFCSQGSSARLLGATGGEYTKTALRAQGGSGKKIQVFSEPLKCPKNARFGRMKLAFGNRRRGNSAPGPDKSERVDAQNPGRGYFPAAGRYTGPTFLRQGVRSWERRRICLFYGTPGVSHAKRYADGAWRMKGGVPKQAIHAAICLITMQHTNFRFPRKTVL